MTDENQIDGTTHAEKDANGDIVHSPDVVSTGDADVTGVTFVDANRSTSVSGVSAGTWTNILDTEIEDNLGEFNASSQFSPSETGYYTVFATARINAGSAGDAIQLRVRGVSNNENTAFLDEDTVGASGSTNRLSGAWTGELSSSQTYELQAVDLDSTYSVEEFRTEAQILKSVVHP